MSTKTKKKLETTNVSEQINQRKIDPAKMGAIMSKVNLLDIKMSILVERITTSKILG